MNEPYRKEISYLAKYDVVVCGAGCAGFPAAVAAARGGAKTLLLERAQMVGGTSTGGMVGPFMISFDGKGERQIVKGIFDELIGRLEAKGGAIHPSKTGDGSPYACYYKGYTKRHNNVTPFRADMMQLEMLKMLDEAGVTLLLGVDVIDVTVVGSKVTGVIVHDGSDLRLYQAGVVIDCTGDAAVSYKAGAVRPECSEGSFETQPMTTFFEIYGADDEALDRYAKEHPEESGMLFRSYIEREMKKGGYPVPRNKIGLYKGLCPGEWRMNCTRIQGLTSTVAEEFTQAYRVGLEQVFFLMDFIRTLPGLENARLKQIAPMVGVRESRRIDGVYSLEAEDLLDPPKVFDDSIAMGSFLLDLHPASGTRAGIETRPVVANCFQIPYRILVPKAVDGLLAAGRCVSGSRDALSSIRAMPQAFAMGQAAGSAAALAIERGEEVRAVDVSALQDMLRRAGAVIE